MKTPTLAVLVAFAASPLAAELRTWKDASGLHEVVRLRDQEFISCHDVRKG